MKNGDRKSDEYAAKKPYCKNECQIKQKAQIVEQTSVQQNFVRSQKVEQTDGQEHSHTRTSIFAKSASNFQLREICSTFLVDPQF